METWLYRLQLGKRGDSVAVHEILFIASSVFALAFLLSTAYAVRLYTKLNIRAVRAAMSGKMRGLRASNEERPGDSLSRGAGASQVRAFSQVGWKGKARIAGEERTDSLSGGTETELGIDLVEDSSGFASDSKDRVGFRMVRREMHVGSENVLLD